MPDIDLKKWVIPLKLHRAIKVKRFCREKSSPTPLPLLVGVLNTTSPSFSSGWHATLIRVKGIAAREKYLNCACLSKDVSDPMVPIEVKPILSWAKVRVSTVLRSRSIFLPAHAQIKKYRRLSTMFNKKTPYPLLHTAKYLKVIEEQVEIIILNDSNLNRNSPSPIISIQIVHYLSI